MITSEELAIQQQASRQAALETRVFAAQHLVERLRDHMARLGSTPRFQKELRRAEATLRAVEKETRDG
jgi:hypothetical protein